MPTLTMEDVLGFLDAAVTITPATDETTFASMYLKDIPATRGLDFLHGTEEVDVFADALEMAWQAKLARIVPETFAKYAADRFGAHTPSAAVRAYILCDCCNKWVTGPLGLSDGELQAFRALLANS